MAKRKPKLKNYDYEFYFLAALAVMGFLLYLQIKSLFFVDTVVPTVELMPEMTVAEEMTLMSNPTAITTNLPGIPGATVITPNKPSYIIDGIDFSKFNLGEEGLQEVMAKMNYDSLRILVTTFYNGAIDILADGNIYRMDQARGGYIYYIVFPKKPEEVTVGDNAVLEHITSNGKYGDYEVYSFTMADFVGEKLEVPVNVTYTDGTEETITLYVTKEYAD